jgi:hypothetical protein
MARTRRIPSRPVSIATTEGSLMTMPDPAE